ncbi:DNA-3-methyladenine glycosylase [Candidatus Pacearchaeota archaeon]|nr:DNA-3-methyladenine glycosylase [Candidatus Pacearchaeota archaeon]
MSLNKLSKDFFLRDARHVAKELLGKILVRKLGRKILMSKIVETEAYFDENDPGSRARQTGDLRKTMLMSAGTILVYGVHNNWLVNFVTNKEGKAEAVLLRALEPLNFNSNCSGPGLLTKAIQINKNFHKKSIFNQRDLWIRNNEKEDKFEIFSTNRIGLRKDLPKKLRFYIKNNKFVSKK